MHNAPVDHIAPLIRDRLHWLRIAIHLTCNTQTVPFIDKASDLVVPAVSDPSGRRLRSANSLNIVRPRTRIKFGDRGFSIAAPDAWNSLPLEIKTAPSLCVFTEKLKTELFKKSYP